MTEVTVQDVRDFLAKMSDDRLKDEVVQANLKLAGVLVTYDAATDAAATDLFQAKLTYAAWLAYLAYATEMERSAGTVPAPVLAHLTVLESLKTLALSHVKVKANSTVAPQLVLSTSMRGWEHEQGVDL